MDTMRDAMTLLARTYLGREASDAELSAMEQEMARDAASIAPHAFGRNGSMFHQETNSFYAILNAEAPE